MGGKKSVTTRCDGDLLWATVKSCTTICTDSSNKRLHSCDVCSCSVSGVENSNQSIAYMECFKANAFLTCLSITKLLCQPKFACPSTAVPRASPTSSCGTIGGCVYGDRIIMVSMEEMLPGLVPSTTDRAGHA
eukprot:12854367-Ditylum_brightwellii.AAC.1